MVQGRCQYVRIGDVVSQSLPLDYGVPQGSILGFPLFTVYINGLLTVPKLCQTACYVGDPKLYLKFKTTEVCNAVSAVNSDVNQICGWCCQNSLLMNQDKTSCHRGAAIATTVTRLYNNTLRQTNIIDTCSKGSWSVFRSVPLL